MAPNKYILCAIYIVEIQEMNIQTVIIITEF